jgi:putative ABC transport system permease protein
MKRSVHPPAWASWLLDRLLPDGEARTPLGDFEELFQAICDESGPWRARMWYVRTVLGMIPRRLLNSFYWSLVMLRNYLKTSLRNLVRYRTYSAINLLGLTLGTTCFILIFLYVAQERGYDRFHPGAERVQRVNVVFSGSDSRFENALSAAPMGPAMQEAIPGIESVARLREVRPDPLVQMGDRRFFESGGYYADSSFFQVFDGFEFMQGNPATALVEPQSIVLSRSMALRYFGLDDPLGHTLRINNETDLVVTGVIKDVPIASHVQFDYLVSFSSLPESRSWWSNPYFTYLKLAPGVDPARIAGQTDALVETNMGEAARRGNIDVALVLQPLLDIRMSPQNNDISSGRGSRHLNILTGIGLLILVLASINFINLATARADTRMLEVGLRKVIGAHRGHLLAQFLGESALLVFLAGAAGIVLAQLVLPWYAGLLETELAFSPGWEGVGILLLTGVAVSLLSGLYPALQMAGLQPVEILKGRLDQMGASGKALSRKLLVIFQFSVSVALIVVTGMVFRQVDYMKTKDLGLDNDQVVVLPINEALSGQVSSLKEAFRNLPDVQSVTWANRAPGMGAYGQTARRANAEDDTIEELKYFYTDGGYASLLDIPVVAGRFFEPDQSAPATGEDDTQPFPQYVINEEAVRRLGWETPEHAIGDRLEWGNQTGEVIGVLADFHFQPMTVFMQPIMMGLRPTGEGYLMVRLQSENMSASLAALEEQWNALAAEWPYTATFLDQDYEALYASQERFGQTFTTFAFLAVVIACLGLFGLATFAVQRRRRELGIRKALGASGPGIAAMLSKEFAILVLLANLLGWPAAWWFLQGWLETFAFRTSLSPDLFIGSGLLALLIALVTVSTQTWRAVRLNPVDALRQE